LNLHLLSESPEFVTDVTWFDLADKGLKSLVSGKH